MASEIIKTVKPSGGDYTSLSAWEAGEQRNLVSADEIAIAECYSMQDTTETVIDGWTTDATRYIRIYTPTSERHDGKWNSSKYRLEISTPANAIYIKENYVRIDGLQIKLTLSAATYMGILVNTFTGSNEIRISNNIIQGVFSGTATTCRGIRINTADAVVKIWNNILYDWLRDSVFFAAIQISTCTTADLYNNTVYNCDYGYLRNGGTVTATNCGAADCAHPFTGAISQTTCSSSTPTFEDEGGDDFHLASSDTTWKDQGTSGQPYGDPDIDGDTRGATWDIGADEVVAGAAVLKIVSETWQLSESTLRLAATTTITNETVQYSEGLIRKGDIIKLVGEVFQFPENIINKLASTRLINETIQWAENRLKVVGLVKLVGEVVQFGENILRLAGIVKLKNETIEINEGIIKTLSTGLVRVVNEICQIAEAKIRVMSSLRIINNIVQFGEGTLRKLSSIRVIGEIVNWSEAKVRLQGSIRIKNEMVQWAENIIQQSGLVRIINETFNWIESITKKLALAEYLNLFKAQIKSLKQRYQIKWLG